MKQTLVPAEEPSNEIVSKYRTYIAVLESRKCAASLINLADSTSALAVINLD